MPSMLKTKAKDPTEAVFGVDGEGAPFHACISAGPHWIVAGETNSGKSVFLNNLLFSMFCHSHPDELQVVWIDPKKVEAAKFVGLPYCPIDPITDMDEASAMLSYLVWMMDDRYEALQRAGVKKISDFNDAVENNSEKMAKLGYTEKMPYWILVVDEYSDMVMQNKDVEGDLIRLGQKARASGIHVLLATQRPSADILTPNLKANMPGRIGLKTADGVNSSIIMGGDDRCATLRGFGDALVKVGTETTRVQGPFLSDGEIDAICADLLARYGESERFDYKSKVVEVMPDKYKWADGYTDDMPLSKRKLVKQSRRRF